jgi:branched-chain amino acid transport system permease protein
MPSGRRVPFGTLGYAIFVAVLAGVPLFAPQFWVTLGNYIGLYSIVALGLVLLTGVAGQTSFGQAAFVGIGAYTTAILCTRYGLSPWVNLAVALAATLALSLFLGFITLRMKGHYLPLATIAWGSSIYYVFGNLEFLGGHTGITGIPSLTLFGLELRNERYFYFLIWGIALAALWVTDNLLDSRPGRAIRALKGQTAMAEAFGVDAPSLNIVVFVYAALLACVSGWLYAHLQRFVNPTPFYLNQGIEYLFMAVVGGAGSVWGAVIGASLITLAKQVLQDVLPALLGKTGNFEIVVFGVLMVLVLQRAREGVWPWFARLLPERASPPVPDAPPLAARPKSAPSPALLEVATARKQFGGLVAVNDLSFAIRSGEILGLIGPNGAGKSTMFNLISGALPLTSGVVKFRGESIGGLSPHQIARRGIGRTFQHVRLLPQMSVRDNVALGAYLRGSAGVLRAGLRLDRAEERRTQAEAARAVSRVGLAAQLNEAAGSLPLGKQRIVEIARALAADPVLLLLDEPAAGLRFREKQELAALLRQLREEGMTILLVEHDMEFVMGLTDRLVVMEFGQKLAEGVPAEIQRNPAVREAYLGTGA